MQPDKIYKLLSDETRLRVLNLIAADQLCVCQLQGIMDVPQPKISKVLAKLRDLNLVNVTREDQYVFYSLTGEEALLEMNLKHLRQNLEAYPFLKDDMDQLRNKGLYTERKSKDDTNF